MRDPLDSQPPAEGALSLDDHVRSTFAAWDEVHVAISGLRADYDAAMRLYERRDGPDPSALRARLKGLQTDCDQLFFTFLRAAETRSRERYI